MKRVVFYFSILALIFMGSCEFIEDPPKEFVPDDSDPSGNLLIINNSTERLVLYVDEYMVKKIPADRLLVETDAPYLTPAPERNQHRRNEPAFVRSVLLKTAEARGEDPAALAEQIWRNTCRLFRMEIEETTS